VTRILIIWKICCWYAVDWRWWAVNCIVI